MFARIEDGKGDWIHVNLHNIVLAEVYRGDTVILYALPAASGTDVRRFMMPMRGIESDKRAIENVVAELEKDSRFLVEEYEKGQQRMFINVDLIVSFEHRYHRGLDKSAFFVVWKNGTESRVSNMNFGKSFDALVVKDEPVAEPDAVR